MIQAQRIFVDTCFEHRSPTWEPSLQNKRAGNLPALPHCRSLYAAALLTISGCASCTSCRACKSGSATASTSSMWLA
jgi:hypothetical protein